MKKRALIRPSQQGARPSIISGPGASPSDGDVVNMASTFYKRPHAGHRAAREKADTDLRVRIEDILAEFPAYGYRRVTHELRRRGW